LPKLGESVRKHGLASLGLLEPIDEACQVLEGLGPSGDCAYEEFEQPSAALQTTPAG
jgi:hypothetical protein